MASIPHRITITTLETIPDAAFASHWSAVLAMTAFSGPNSGETFLLVDPGGSTAGRLSVPSGGVAISAVDTVVAPGVVTSFLISPTTQFSCAGIIYYLDLPGVDYVRYDVYDADDVLLGTTTNEGTGDGGEAGYVIVLTDPPPTVDDFWTDFAGTFEVP